MQLEKMDISVCLCVLEDQPMHCVYVPALYKDWACSGAADASRHYCEIPRRGSPPLWYKGIGAASWKYCQKDKQQVPKS